MNAEKREEKKKIRPLYSDFGRTGLFIESIPD